MNIKENDYLIIGINISGLLMAARIQKMKPKSKIFMIDKRSENDIDKSADTIPFYLNNKIDLEGLSFISAKLNTYVWYNNQMNTQINEQIINEYARKIVNQNCPNTLNYYTSEKNIFNLSNNGRQKELLYFLKELLEKGNVSFFYETELFKINTKSKSAVTSIGIISYNNCISTIPLCQMKKIIDIDINNYTKCYSSTFVVRGYKMNDKNLYNVCYCPDRSIRFYRIAILDNITYIESKYDFSYSDLNKQEKNFLNIFGINKSNVNNYLFKKYMEPGRIVENDLYDTYKLKRELAIHDIYLLGRYAEWRYKLTEDVWEETKNIIEKIEKKNERNND